MALTYNLPGEMTNGDLAESHADIHAGLFAICVTTMHTGVRTINGEWLDRMMETVDNGDQMWPHMSPEEERQYLCKIYRVLRGMTTNASTKTKTEFAETLANR